MLKKIFISLVMEYASDNSLNVQIIKKVTRLLPIMQIYLVIKIVNILNTFFAAEGTIDKINT